MAEMHTLEERNAALEEFSANVQSVIDEKPEIFSVDLNKVLSDSLEEGRGNSGLREFILDRLDKVAKSCVPVGVPVPRHTVRLNVAEVNGDYRIDILLGRNTASFVDNFRFEKRWLGSNITVESVLRFYEGAYRTLINRILAKSNIQIMNDILLGLGDEVESPYIVAYRLRSESGASNSAFLGEVSDTLVEFLISEDKALEASQFSLFSTPISEEEMEGLLDVDLAVAELHNKSIADAREYFEGCLRGAPRTIDFIEAKPASVKALTGIGTHRVHTLIAKSVSRRVEGLRRSIKRTVRAVVHKDDVVGIVEWNGEDQTFEVVLPAFYVNTLEDADFDLVAYAESVLSD